MDGTIRRAVARAATHLHEARSFDDTLEDIVRGARTALPAYEHIGISIIKVGGRMVTRAASTPLTYELDAIQYGGNEGPCLDCLDVEEVVTAPNVRTDSRWPHYVGQAARAGLRSQLAVRLHIDGQGAVGSLNVYSTTTTNVDEKDVHILDLFAIHAAVTLTQVHYITSLREGLASRRLIGQAIGIVMERYRIDEKAAQAFVWRTSSHSNVKVRDVAAAIVAENNEARR